MKKQAFMKKIGLALGVLLMLGTVPNVSHLKVEAASVQKSSVVYTTTDSLNLRSGASTKYKVLVKIPKGKTVSMVTYGKSWSKVKHGSKTGYVSTKYLKKTTTTKKTPTVKVRNFLSKADSIKLLTGASFSGEKRKIFEVKNEYGLTFVNSFMLGATRDTRDEYQFVNGEYDAKKLSSMAFYMNWYNKHPYGQKNGMQALELGLSGFFGKGTAETAQLIKLVKENMKYTKDKNIEITIGGKKGFILVNKMAIHVVFDYNGSLPILK